MIPVSIKPVDFPEGIALALKSRMSGESFKRVEIRNMTRSPSITEICTI